MSKASDYTAWQPAVHVKQARGVDSVRCLEREFRSELGFPVDVPAGARFV
jgi:hypothetical protein